MEKEDTNERIDLKGKPTVKYAHNDCKPSIFDCKIEDNSLSNLDNNESSLSHSSINQDSNSIAQKMVKEDMVEFASVITDDQLQDQPGSSSDTKLIPLTNSYPNYVYNTPGNFYTHANQQTYPVIYNSYEAMNTQWSYNQVQPVHTQSNDEMTAATSTSMAQSAESQSKNGTVSMLLNEMFDLLQVPSIWNIFDEIQKKKLSEMRQKVVNIAEDHSKEIAEERVECEMDFSDDDCVSENPSSSSDSLGKITKEDVEKMKQERDSAQKKLEALLQVQAYVLETNAKNYIAHITRLNEMKEKLKATEAELNELRRKRKKYLADHSQDIVEVPEEIENESIGNQSSFLQITQEDMRFICLITLFLNTFPFGASIQYICAYLQRIDPTITDRYVENLMRSHSNIFQEKDAASKTWICIAFH